MNSSPALAQLESARGLALSEGRYYPTIVPGILPIIGASATLEVRRWGAEFLAETFASPTWPTEAKESLSLQVLETLRGYLETAEDTGIVKSAVQAAASVYPLVFRHIATNPHDTQNWQPMSAIKSNILRRMDTAAPGVRICCVKFVQQVVLVETPGYIADPRRVEQNDISLALVSRDHPLIPPQNLEAEASGLLDRLLDIIHGDHSDALLVTATLNALGTLVQRRPSIANKILGSVLNFNPLKLANAPLTVKNKVIMRSLERTAKALLVNVLKRHPDTPFNQRIQQYLERIHRMRQEIFDETLQRKRAAPVEPTDGLDQAKRQRLAATVPESGPAFPPLPPGPVSIAQLFTLTTQDGAKNFDVQAIPVDVVTRLLIPVLRSIDHSKMDAAINAVRSRYLTLSRTHPRSAADAANAAIGGPPLDDEDEYEPDDVPVEDVLDHVPPQNIRQERIPDAPLAIFKLPEAPPLTVKEAQHYGEDAIKRIFEVIASFDEQPAKAKHTNQGFNRLAASGHDRDSYITMVIRLATRTPAFLNAPEVKSEDDKSDQKGNLSISESIRRSLHNYIMYDWRKRIDVAISWLNEEWFSDRIQLSAAQASSEISNGDSEPLPMPKQHYQKWVLRILDSIVPYVESTDKNAVIRFLSEVPELNRDIFERVKHLADDPDRVALTVQALQYLHLFKPPVRDLVVDTLEDLYKSNNDAKPFTQKLLAKWRPEALQIAAPEVKSEAVNGNVAVQAA